MRLLILDSPGRQASAAITEGGSLVWWLAVPGRRSLADLFPSVERAIAVRPPEMILVCRGPGSPGTVRSLVSFALGLGAGLAVPVHGFSAWDVLCGPDAEAGIVAGKGTLAVRSGDTTALELASSPRSRLLLLDADHGAGEVHGTLRLVTAHERSRRASGLLVTGSTEVANPSLEVLYPRPPAISSRQRP